MNRCGGILIAFAKFSSGNSSLQRFYVLINRLCSHPEQASAKMNCK